MQRRGCNVCVSGLKRGLGTVVGGGCLGGFPGLGGTRDRREEGGAPGGSSRAAVWEVGGQGPGRLGASSRRPRRGCVVGAKEAEALQGLLGRPRDCF